MSGDSTPEITSLDSGRDPGRDPVIGVPAVSIMWAPGMGAAAAPYME